jgi:hypothetical protein
VYQPTWWSIAAEAGWGVLLKTWWLLLWKRRNESCENIFGDRVRKKRLLIAEGVAALKELKQSYDHGLGQDK